MKKCLITKQLSGEQRDLLLRSNIPFECLPVLDFKLGFDEKRAAKLLSTPDAVWVFTSVRAVQALYDLLPQAATPSKIFTVGKNAAEALASLGFKTDFCGQVSEDLLPVLAQQRHRPILYFRGRHYRSSIPDFCEATELDFQTLECYHSIKLPPPDGLPDCGSVWVFSPLSAQAVSEWEGVPRDLPIFSIGSVTDAHLKKLGFKNVQSPKEPSFENMVELYLENNSALR
jgi:uroporphyrinogen-III synthase